ncbi:MAG: hypothetical protein WC655_16720 [Candidatus Hydrogenedentales bacterium]
MTMIRERDIQKQIVEYLSYRPDIKVWRQNCGAFVVGKRFVRFGIPGQADITGIMKGGRRIEIEVKTKRGKLSPEQETFRKMIEDCGGLYIVARDLDDVLAALAELIREKS